MGSTRWPSAWSEDKIPSDWIIHARYDGDDKAFCEKDGPALDPHEAITLVLDHPDAKYVSRGVDCPGCLSWMHA